MVSDLPEHFAAVVLAGGKGTRLRSVVADRPKVLAPVAGRPFLAYLLDQIVASGAQQIVLSTGYLAEQFADSIGETHRGVPIAYAQEDAPLGTGGAIKFAGGRADAKHLLVMNGDSYLDADLGAFLRRHFEEQNDVSLLLAAVPDASRYGAVAQDDAGRVTAFLEKQPGLGAANINAGIYALRSDLLAEIPAGPCSFERDVMPDWIARHAVKAMAVDRPFIDIGVPEDYQRSREFMERLAHD